MAKSAVAEPINVGDHHIPFDLGLGGINSGEKNDSTNAFCQHTPFLPIDEPGLRRVTRLR